MDEPFQIAYPRDGKAINPELAYVAKKSALRQAEKWNAIFESDPQCGADSGFVVGIGPRRDDRRYPLVWVRTAPDAPRGNGT